MAYSRPFESVEVCLNRTDTQILNKTRKCFHLMLSSMSAAAVAKCFFWENSETVRASHFKIFHKVPSIVFTYQPEMTSLSTTSGRKQIVKTCKFWVMFGSRCLDNVLTDSERVYSFGNWDGFKGFISPFCNLLDIFAP